MHLDPTVAVAVVPVEAIVPTAVRHKEVQETVIVIIRPATASKEAHVAGRAAEADGSEGPVPVVVVQGVRGLAATATAVHDKQVQETVVVVIRPGAPVRIHGSRDRRALRHLREPSVPLIMVEAVVGGSPDREVGDEQVREAVVVIVAPGASAGTDLSIVERSAGDSGESPVPVVVVKHAATVVRRDIQVGVTVIVVVGPRGAVDAITRARESSAGGRAKRAVPFVLEQDRALGARGVADEHVKPAIVVIVHPTEAPRIGNEPMNQR